MANTCGRWVIRLRSYSQTTGAQPGRREQAGQSAHYCRGSSAQQTETTYGRLTGGYCSRTMAVQHGGRGCKFHVRHRGRTSFVDGRRAMERPSTRWTWHSRAIRRWWRVVAGAEKPGRQRITFNLRHGGRKTSVGCGWRLHPAVGRWRRNLAIPDKRTRRVLYEDLLHSGRAACLGGWRGRGNYREPRGSDCGVTRAWHSRAVRRRWRDVAGAEKRGRHPIRFNLRHGGRKTSVDRGRRLHAAVGRQRRNLAGAQQPRSRSPEFDLRHGGRKTPVGGGG